MKTIKLTLIALVAVLMCACTDTVSPVSQKIQGPLGEYFEVVSKDYEKKDGKVSIEIKRIKTEFPSPWHESLKLGQNDNCFEPQFTIEFLDSDDKVLSNAKTDIEVDKNELEKIASLGVNESATITFTCEDAAKKFTMGSKFNAQRTINLEGNIGKYPIMMTMHIANDGTVTGAYYYKSQGRGNYLYIKGKKSGDHIALKEFTMDGQQTGTYDGTFKNDIYRGRFDTRSGNYEFVLSPTEMEYIDFGSIDFDAFYTDDMRYSNTINDDDFFRDSAGSADWDELLESYEQYVEQYISLVKKAAKGDMSAVTDYMSFLNKAQELSNKMEGAKEEMSISQWSRYIKITEKMAKAAQEMQ